MANGGPARAKGWPTARSANHGTALINKSSVRKLRVANETPGGPGATPNAVQGWLCFPSCYLSITHTPQTLRSERGLVCIVGKKLKIGRWGNGQNETQDILLPANNSTLKQTNNTRALRGWYWCSIANATNGQHNRADSIINCCNCTFCGAFVPFFSLPSSLSLSMDSIFCAFALEGIIKKKGEQGKKDARLRMRVFVCEPARTH